MATPMSTRTRRVLKVVRHKVVMSPLPEKCYLCLKPFREDEDYGRHTALCRRRVREYEELETLESFGLVRCGDTIKAAGTSGENEASTVKSTEQTTRNKADAANVAQGESTGTSDVTPSSAFKKLQRDENQRPKKLYMLSCATCTARCRINSQASRELEQIAKTWKPEDTKILCPPCQYRDFKAKLLKRKERQQNRRR